MPHLLIIANEQVRQRAMTWVKNSPIGTRITFREPKRSTEQNDKMWAMLTDVSKQATFLEKKYTPEEWKVLFMAELNHEVDFLPRLNGSGFIPIGHRSSKLSVKQMADLITFIQSWCDQNGIELNEPMARAA